VWERVHDSDCVIVSNSYMICARCIEYVSSCEKHNEVKIGMCSLKIIKSTWNTCVNEVLSWSWSYGSWIYNYLYNQKPITTKAVCSNRTDAVCTRCDKVCQWLTTGRWFSPGTLKLTPRYSWNIVESGVKPHNPTLTLVKMTLKNRKLHFYDLLIKSNKAGNLHQWKLMCEVSL